MDGMLQCIHLLSISRGIEPSVPESHENQECISKRYSIGKDAVPCQ